MPTPPLPPERLEEALAALVATGGNVSEAARRLGLPRNTFNNRLVRARASQPSSPVAVVKPSDGDIPLEALLEQRLQRWQYASEAVEERKLISVRVDDRGPIGIAIFGDPHLDDEGCDLGKLIAHTRAVCTTEGAYAGCVGDITNNWVGRLAHLWADQSTSARDAWRLAEWWLQELGEKLLFLTEGNHDGWARGVLGDSPFDWLRSRRHAVVQPHGLRLEIKLRNDFSVVVNCRHDFRGRSQFNPAFGPAKAAWFGWRDDVLVCGHLHTAGYTPLRDPKSGLVSHAIRIASYKAGNDAYADRLGLPDQNLFEACLLILDPDAIDSRFRVKVYLDLLHGLQVLRWMRSKNPR